MLAEDFLDDLCPRVRPLVAHILSCGCGCAALDLFQNRPRTWNETADIAYHLQQPTEEVIQDLNLLADLGVIDRRDSLGMTFYRLTEDKEILQALDQYWTSREVWRARWQETRVALEL
ncbi:MAG: hypothetical protein HY741_23055 [Chloroflexi bacterium]|nr:hypothetical protein [Chloroflexota bacterium]